MNGHYLHLNSIPDWKDGLLGLMYHAVEAPPLKYGLRALYVTPSRLDAQLKELQREGVNFTTLSDWAQNRPAGRQVVVTFDDAFFSVFHNAMPVLQKRKIPAITYVVTNEIGGINRWDSNNAQVRPLMDRAAILEWLAAGFEIGAHTMTHCNLSEVPLARARAEIFDSKKILEDLTGREIRHFCYPYGGTNAAVRELVMEAGYETSPTAHPGLNDRETDLFTLLRYLAAHRRPYQTALRHRLLHPFGGHSTATIK